MIRSLHVGCVLVACTLIACASSTRFISSWKAENAAPLKIAGSRVAAVAMMESEASRRAAEDAMARELRERGAQGIPMYTILPNAHDEAEDAARIALRRADVQGVVVMRPVAVEQELVVTPDAFAAPYYRFYWGGYRGFGWADPWDYPGTSSELSTNTVVSVETLVYSMPQNELVWGGQSRTTDPDDVDALVTEVAAAVAEELEAEGLIAR